MLRQYYYLLTLLMFCGLSQLGAQDFPPEDICVPLGQGFVTNIVNDNVPPGGDFTLETSTYESECFYVDTRGNLFFSPNAKAEFCCGPQQPFVVEVFRVLSNGETQFIGIQEVSFTIKCPKPDCGLVDLEEFLAPGQDPTGQNPDSIPPCISACERSTATYLFASDAGLSYDWMATNGAVMYNPALPGQLTITWGPIGAASISVDIYDANGNLIETRVWCVELTPAPIADFTFVADACLDQEVYFTNTSSGAPASFDWKFGDGGTAINVTNPSHAYGTPGTYTVTMYATSTSVNPDGSQGCCCTDSISYDIVIDPLPAPGIFWISTLCEGDISKYWTDATNCGTIEWNTSSNGNIMGSNSMDTVMVQWNEGPSGTITLEVDGCDITYCPYPSTAVVPIISSIGTITGPVAVCKGATASYELPKWMTVEYNWATSDATAVINGSNNGHIVSVTWPTVPGTYTLEVNYGSDFLSGLPNHDGDDCYGSASIEVTVLGDFTITATPNPICDGNSSFLQGFSDIGVTSYNWTVDGFPGLSATGPTATMPWPGPGIYSVTAEVINPADYCVDSRSLIVVVKDAVNPVIVGPSDYCVGEPVVYTILSPTPGYTYNWTAGASGSVTAGNGGPTVTVIFTVTSGASLTVVGVDGSAPNCSSDPVVVTPVTKDFMGSPVITGPAPCTNSQAVYGIDIPQHADATYTWSVSPEIAGSVVQNADSPNPTINWNNVPASTTVTITLNIELCGQVLPLTTTLILNVPVKPNIVQVGSLCPSGSAVLEVDGSLFSSIMWSTGASTPMITITAEGNYTVSTVDLNGCPSIDVYRVDEVDGPSVSLSLTGTNRICVNDTPFPPNPTLFATTAAANTIEWFCNSVSQGAAATGNASLIHVWDANIQTYAYTATVTDPNGCTTTPDPIFIYQQPCCRAPYITQPLAQNHIFTAIQRSPDCDIVDLVATWSADSVDCHGWDLPRYTTVLGGGGDAGVANDSLTIRLPGAGCFKVESEIFNWAYDYDTTMVINPFTGLLEEVVTIEDSIKCGDFIQLIICNPFSAEFDFSENCGTVSFTDISDIDFSLVSGGLNYNWDFGDGVGTDNVANPTYIYTANGSYTVTLVISDNDCQSSYTFPVVVDNLPDSDFTLFPNPACWGQAVTFTGTGTSVISWEWDFGDGATFTGNNPQHTFMPVAGFGTSPVRLITINTGGCRDTVDQVITISPVPDDTPISASNTFIICDGSSTTLSVPAVAGNTYLWSTTATTNSIVVSTAGTYGVTITNSDNCSTVIAPVEVQVIPLPDASWTGNPFICDNGSTTLTASAGGGHNYLWTNLTTGETVTTRDYTVNYFASPAIQDIVLTVESIGFGCISESFIKIQQVASPTPVVVVTGGTCEGDGSTITVTNPQPDVVYSWSTGETGLSIFTFQAGTYTVLATDVISGCTGAASATINPLPDLCLVPTGCYETCAPDTLYAPLGNYAYAWYDENGIVIDTDDSTVVTMSGVYHVVVTDLSTGCFNTSGDLYLTVIDCDDPCLDLVTRITPSQTATAEGDCCYDLTYSGLPSGVAYIRVSSGDAELFADPSLVNPALGYVGTPNAFTVEFAIDAALSTELPSSMTGPPVATICPQAIINTPQVLLVEYLDADGNVVCFDKVEMLCEPKPECVYVTNDSLYCDKDGTLTLDFTICTPFDLTFDLAYIELLASSAQATIDLPFGMTVSPPMTPGECRDFTIILSELVPGKDFCYTLVGHSADPDIDPTALCCSDQEPRCLEIPDCDPCDELFVEGVVPVDGDDCCYDIYLVENAASYDFDQIDLCLIGGDATLSLMTTIGNPLTGTVNNAGTKATIFAASGRPLPAGLLQLPRLCLNDGSQTEYLLEIKWINDDNVLCRDTVSLFCEPDCGYLQEELVECDGDRYIWSGNIVNTSDFTMGEAHIKFPVASGLGAYDTTIVFPTAIPPGAVAFVSIEIGGPAGPGDTICFIVALHEMTDDDDHVNCCIFEAKIVLPDCALEDCNCEGFAGLVTQGVDTIHIGPGPRDYLLKPKAQFSSCDQIRWRVRTLNPSSPWVTLSNDAYSVPFSFTGNFHYQVAMTVFRRAPDGSLLCTPRTTYPRYDFRQDDDVDIKTSSNLELFPNPAVGEVNLLDLGDNFYNLGGTIGLLDVNGKQVRTFSNQQATVGEVRTLNLKGLTPGVYILKGEGKDGTWAKRFIVHQGL
jgi:PKD repeat protein